MLLAIGYIIVLGSILGGFMIAGGKPILLLHISEFVVIGGVSVGVLIVSSPSTVLKNVVKDIKESFGQSGASAEEFMDLLKMLYELFMLSRKGGLIALDEHMGDPHNSSIFNKYPSFLKHPERVEFLINALRPIVDGKIKPEQLQSLLIEEVECKEEEAGGSISVLSLIGDSLPGIGIVAAVLGIINTMAAIAEGPEKVGEKVAAALTGTFLGVLGAYGFINPLCKRIQFGHKSHLMYFNTMVKAVSGFAKGLAPVMAIEVARRSLDKAVQPTADNLEKILKNLKSS